MPILQFSFDNQINSSVQVGDTALFSSSLAGIIHSEPQVLGEITNIQNGNIEVDVAASVTVNSGDFFLFSKPIQINESSLKGYYADVTFKNASKTYAELFAVSSEVVPSSK